jgi:hypothetical protein
MRKEKEVKCWEKICGKSANCPGERKSANIAELECNTSQREAILQKTAHCTLCNTLHKREKMRHILNKF